MLNRTRVVLMHTTHPGNIGATARAMKTMGLERLYLVQPEQFPHSKADEMAANAKDILSSAIVVQTLDEAMADCQLVIGTSARSRAIPWPLHTPRQMAEKAASESDATEIALLFGQEQSGLSNDVLQRCHYHLQIPANPEYSVLNLAAAVQVIAYEWRVASLQVGDDVEEWDYRLATADEMEKYFSHLEEVLIQIDFLKQEAPRKLMTRLRRLFLRTRPDVMEMNILRGMLTAVQEKIK
ncbi:MAG TPA: tRNA (cytosine(32)/uridine(32)-2'-O)-methyltransferase TrmJ [Gammaproteobacteria bacterium]|nr:tRNA (cytosine(32)/uridine(32)-2'-O)-methyltransferase TrmJ [Gammaproteobacteria bacterium]